MAFSLFLNSAQRGYILQHIQSTEFAQYESTMEKFYLPLLFFVFCCFILLQIHTQCKAIVEHNTYNDGY